MEAAQGRASGLKNGRQHMVTDIKKNDKASWPMPTDKPCGYDDDDEDNNDVFFSVCSVHTNKKNEKVEENKPYPSFV